MGPRHGVVGNFYSRVGGVGKNAQFYLSPWGHVSIRPFFPALRAVVPVIVMNCPHDESGDPPACSVASPGVSEGGASADLGWMADGGGAGSGARGCAPVAAVPDRAGTRAALAAGSPPQPATRLTIRVDVFGV